MYNFRRIETIKRFDRSDMFGLLVGLPEQCRRAVELSRNVRIPKRFANIDKIVVSGMGGSAISGDILRSLLSARLNIPVLVNRDYSIPKFIDRKTLFFAASFSGNTEETLTAFSEAKKRNAKIIGISSGGKLERLCHRYGFPLYKLPGGQPPRTAIGYLFFPLLSALIDLGIGRDIDKEIDETLLYLNRKVIEYSSRKHNLAYTLTQKCFGYIPVIYGSGEVTGVCAFRWKTQFNENSKIPAFSNLFPELDHNEIMGWEGPKSITGKFVIFILKDRNDSVRMDKRIRITIEVIGKKPYAFYEVCSEGYFLLTRIFSLILLGDFLSFYTAIARGVDPTVIRGIDILKEGLAGS